MSLEKNLSPLFRLALKSGALDAIALHIHRGESPNGRDAAGLTPLMIAAINNQQTCCTRLISLGADVSLRSAGGRTAVELALEHGHLTLASVLSSPPSSAADAPESLDDLNGWAADDTVSTPVHDAGCVLAAMEIQKRISEHRRAGDETDWSAIEFDLPEVVAHQSSVQTEDFAAIECLVETGLRNGYVTTSELGRAMAVDCGAAELQRSLAVVERVLDDLGVLIECDGMPLPTTRWGARHDELAAALDTLRDDLAEPPAPVNLYLAESRRYNLIKREDEERLGRQMDSALGELTRILAFLPEAEWLLFAPRATAFSEVADMEEGEDETETVESIEPAEVQEGVLGEQGDFRSYVHSIRNGAPEYGRDAAVPRPGSVDLTRMLDTAALLDAGTAVACAIAAYETARDRLVTANLRLATSLAHNYRYSGLPLEDLIQEANVGLMRAAERFDFRRGFKFSTYAMWWIRQGVARSVQDASRTIRVPVHQGEKLNQVHRARRELEYGRAGEVRPEEIARHLSMSLRQVQQILRLEARVLSFEECGPGREPYTPDPSSIVDPLADFSLSSCDFSLTAAIDRMLAELDKRGREVIMARFGFDGADGKTLEEVGQQFGVTRERIRQVEAKVLSKLRHASRIEILAPYAPIFCPTTNKQEP